MTAEIGAAQDRDGGRQLPPYACVGRGAGPVLIAALLLLGAAPAAATVSAPTATISTTEAANLPPPVAADKPFVAPADRLAAPPSSLADGVKAVQAAPPFGDRWQTVWSRRGLSFGEIVAAAAAQPLLLPIAIAGVALIAIASYARRRRRRRIGWGVLPERPQRGQGARED